MQESSKKEKIVVFSGAGISAESGLSTFRDSDGTWEQYSIDEVATRSAFKKDPETVIDFYNLRKKRALEAEPNAAHKALVELETKYDVIIITQNVDDLHERAGSSNVMHLHGRLNYAQSSVDSSLVYDWGDKPIKIGQLCEKGSQLRPNVVLFDECVELFSDACKHFKEADKILVVGTSLQVEPAASMLTIAPWEAEKVIVTLDFNDNYTYGYRALKEKATLGVPKVCKNWMHGKKAIPPTSDSKDEQMER